MRLKDPFGPLDKSRRRIGAREHNFRFDKLFGPSKEIERKLETTGILVELPDIKSVGPLLTYKGEILAILYIRNSDSPSEDLLSNQPWLRTPRFHFTWCQTLDQMKRSKKFDSYVSSRSKTNRFQVESLEIEGERHMLENIRLFPCRYCLKKINYHGYQSNQPENQKLDHVFKFSIEAYLEENDDSLIAMKHLPKIHV